MSSQIAIRLSDDQLARIDEAVQAGRFASRADAVRAGIESLLREERDREIAERYRQGYAKHPQEAWIGEAGLAAGAGLVRQERRRSQPRR